MVDIWQGYPVERNELLGYIADNNLDDVVILTGDIHVTFAFDIAKQLENEELENYDPDSGEGSYAVELVTPSITSDGFNEALGDQLAGIITTAITNLNPHLKKINVFDHGYFILDVTKEKVQADWYYMEDITKPNLTQNYSDGLFTDTGDNHLQATNTESEGKAEQDTPAPADPPAYVGIRPYQPNKDIKDFVFIAQLSKPNQ